MIGNGKYPHCAYIVTESFYRRNTMNINTVICGGDRRMLSAAALFSKIGNCKLWRCASGDVGGCKRSDNLTDACRDSFVILPIPAFDKNGILNGGGHINADEFFRQLPCRSVVYGGKISSIVRRIASEHGHIIHDYGEREDFNLFNSIPTAEAAILIASEHLTTTIKGNRFAVIGYGRIAKALSSRLSLFGAAVTVFARSDSALSAAECDGHEAVKLSTITDHPLCGSVCFNTVPYMLFDKADIEKWEVPYYIELASAPGGFTEDAKRYLGDRYISALSLPGRYFPDTAGEIIYKTVLTMINNGGAI